MDITTGTKIEWSEPVFAGSFRRPKKVGERTITGTVLRESYGAQRGQHTFTIEPEKCTGYDADEVLNKTTIRRKGRNIYNTARVLSKARNHAELAREKHQRAEQAKNQKYLNWINDAETDPWTYAEKLDRIPPDWLARNPDANARIEALYDS